MFVKAIERAGEFTRPIHMVSRYYQSTLPQAGAATLFMVNDEGWALTCRHVAATIIATQDISQRKRDFQAANVGKMTKQDRFKCERKYKIDRANLYELLVQFVDCADTFDTYECRSHVTLDMALIRFNNFKMLHPKSFPLFAKNGDGLQPGKSLCRLGYPFAEFTNFAYDKDSDCTAWTKTGVERTPRFPMDGMVTRLLSDGATNIVGFEMSTPGLKGQSGGPAFDTDGVIWGMQYGTASLDLDFDVNMDVVRQGSKKRVQDNAFLHVGHCVHVNAMKQYMQTNGVAFQEG